MEQLSAIFGQGHDLSVAQECARAALIFLYGLVVVRLAGRRLFGKWSALDIVVSIVIGSNLSRALTGSAPLVGTLAASTLLMALHWLLGLLAARSRAVSWLVEGQAIDLARGGDVAHDVRIRHAVSQADLDEALRQKEVEDASETQRITLEPSGKISVLRTAAKR